MTMGTESFDSDDFIHQELTKLGPKNIRAERATFMSRTSDTLGEFVKSDINSYLDLIRRKVQQKCSTIQELMHQIRINKIRIETDHPILGKESMCAFLVHDSCSSTAAGW